MTAYGEFYAMFDDGEVTAPQWPSKSRYEIFEDYDGFVEKFKAKKTTDDCYTPPAVFDAVRQWVHTNVMPLDGVEIVRPFKPGGDYEHEAYPDGCVVLDNPPFSILAKIVRFYTVHGIRFFLFAPGLTLFANARHAGVTAVVVKKKHNL